MSSTIFLIGDDNSLTRLSRADYDSEELFQRLLAEHPSVLGLTSESDELLLIQRELSVPDDDGAGGRWALDHLFVDREGVPVLVEVKRGSDTRARREVVAQMLDYAANGVAYWPLNELIEAFEKSYESQETGSGEVLSRFLEGNSDPESFWQRVDANLRSGRIRMVFVADRIPKELRRIVEFLNEQMRPAEMMAVEVAQFVGEGGVRTLVPALVGQTERARTVKRATAEHEPISLEVWLDRFTADNGSAAREAAERVLDWAKSEGCDVGISNSQDSVFMRWPTADGKWAWPFFVRHSSGRFETSLQYLKSRPAFASEGARQRVLDRFGELSGVTLSTKKLTGWPAFPVSMLLDEQLWAPFQSVARWIIEEAKKS